MVPAMNRRGCAALAVALWGNLMWVGCGDDSDGGSNPVTAAEARDYYGLTPGTCIVYSRNFSDVLKASVEVTLPPENLFPGRDVRQWELNTIGSSDLAIRRWFEVVGGEVRMIRDQVGTTTDNRFRRDYEDAPPLWAVIQRQTADELEFQGNRFTVTTTPTRVVGPDGEEDDGTVEVHTWDLTDDDVDFEGMSTFAFQYLLERDNDQDSSAYNFVPFIGFVRIDDFGEDFGGTGAEFRMIDSRVCSESGSCEGNPSECTPL